MHVIESRKKNVYAANSTGEKKTSISAKQEQSWKEYTMWMSGCREDDVMVVVVTHEIKMKAYERGR